MEIASRTEQDSVITNAGVTSSGGSCSSSSLPLYQNPPPPPLTPKGISRSEAAGNPYPTTFVQADSSSFKQVVQMLTGSSGTAKNPSDPPPSAAAGGNRGFSLPPKKQGFKALYERRNVHKNGFMISPLIPGGASPRKPEILSPSILNFPSLALSPVTPLNEDAPFGNSSPSVGNSSEEDRAIAEKKFYLHPSPRSATPRDSPPQLLSLFPDNSAARVLGSSSS
ncbi:unnamed protein product [Cuscuta epithymum]|uniref:VQ domain-containing protein n=1 Tax=Cuscuta epithymum TaxID=186058 RepID=A0AAV0E8C6_9ASTE|nr:unnamed protein product [Cuscuta epithymum]